MELVEVIIEYPSSSLNRPFSYAYEGIEPIKIGVRVIVPFASRRVVGYVVNIKKYEKTRFDYEQETGFILKYIERVIDKEPILNEELINLAYKVSDYYFAPLISVFQSMLPPSLKPKFSSLNKPKIAYDTYLKALDCNIDSLTKKQKEIYFEIKHQGEVLKSSIKSTVIKKLLDSNCLQIVLKEKHRLKDDEYIKQLEKTLNEEQQFAFDKIINNPKGTYLLEGVTGSGKTEVYLHLAKHFINNNKTVLILVPEISLSYQMVKHFKERFDKVAILHSSLTDAEKYDEYRRISSGDVNLVVGARSAIFAPLKNIGLIVIDEEHSETYKQENLPYYHALKVAEYRRDYHDAVLLLGSATPSLESRARAFKGTYNFLKLNKRISTILPNCKIVDLNSYKEIDEKSILFSKTLRDAIQERLNKKEQVMLLLNRRGFAPHVSCRKCGFVFKCPECNMPLSFHKDGNLLKCHHCGYEAKMINKCPKCESNYIKTVGFGSQKAEDELFNLFPNARILRLDSDVAKRRLGVKETLEIFKNQDADILIGTQMIAKGHDFSKVTLSAVLMSDIGLNIPSYRASERVFSLLTQTIGRAGRSVNGEAIIQTYNPNHYAIKLASEQDYEGFFNLEMKYRKMSYYPPFCYCALITLASEKEDILNTAILDLKNMLIAEFVNKEVDVIGPSDYYVGIIKGKHRKKILLKYKNYNDIVDSLKKLIDIYSSQNLINLSINIDPIEDY